MSSFRTTLRVEKIMMALKLLRHYLYDESIDTASSRRS